MHHRSSTFENASSNRFANQLTAHPQARRENGLELPLLPLRSSEKKREQAHAIPGRGSQITLIVLT
jgi:hypothetical protein